jgi:hypothetical protein
MRDHSIHSLPVTLGVLGLMLYWFAFANRAIVFLYNHDMGPLFPDTGAFSLVTRSRYWMTGLVASGMVLVVYSSIAWMLGRWRRGYRPPPWRQVWLLCALPLTLGIPLITMTVNMPVLSLEDALLATVFTLAGLAFALAPGEVAAMAPGRFFWLAVDGLGVAALVFSFTLIEQAHALAQRGNSYGIALMLAGALIGALILLASSFVQRRLHCKPERITALLAAGVCWAYLFFPAVHHLLFTDGWLYITTMDNFFPNSWLIFVVGWTIAGLIVGSVARLRRWEVER